MTLESVEEVFYETTYQRCAACFYGNMFSVTICSKVKRAAKTLKAIHTQESNKAMWRKAGTVEENCALESEKVARNTGEH